MNGFGEALRETGALLVLRRIELVPRFGNGTHVLNWSCEGDALRIMWKLDEGHRDGHPSARLHLIANFGKTTHRLAWPPGRIVHMLRAMDVAGDNAVLQLLPGGVCASIDEAWHD